MFVVCALVISIIGCNSDVDISIDEVSNKTVIGSSQLEDIACWNDSFGIYGRAVARMYTNTSNGGWCTGFLVNRKTLLTAYHCVSTQSELDNTFFDFDYKHAECDGTTLASGGSGTIGGTLLATNLFADVSVIELNEDFGSVVGILDMNFSAMNTSQNLMIIQHPAGEYKQLVRFTDNNLCRATSLPNFFEFNHACDTKGGSSGSPVLLQPAVGVVAPMSVVGLHSAGATTYNVGKRATSFQTTVEPYLVSENSCVGRCGRRVTNRDGTPGCWCVGSGDTCVDKVQLCGRK